MGRFATGVTVVTVARGPEQVHGMTANSFTSVSLDPMLILVCVGRNALALTLLRAQKRFGVNILAEDQRSLSEYFARTEQNGDVPFERTAQGTPLLKTCLARLECQVIAAHEAGDHTIFLGQVETLETRDGRPLLFYSGEYRQLDSDK